MYLVKVGSTWVSAMTFLSNDQYDVKFTTNKSLSVKLGQKEVECLKNDFDITVYRMEYREVDLKVFKG